MALHERFVTVRFVVMFLCIVLLFLIIACYILLLIMFSYFNMCVCVCVCAFVTLNKKISYLLSDIANCGMVSFGYSLGLGLRA